jgi:hypothetical protein
LPGGRKPKLAARTWLSSRVPARKWMPHEAVSWIGKSKTTVRSATTRRHFKWKDYRIKERDRYKLMTLATDEFIRRFLIHVLPAPSTASATTVCSPTAPAPTTSRKPASSSARIGQLNSADHQRRYPPMRRPRFSPGPAAQGNCRITRLTEPERPDTLLYGFSRSSTTAAV